MPLKISDEEVKHVQSGTALRFTVHFVVDADGKFWTQTKGFMAFRKSNGDLEIKAPMMMLNLYGKRIRYFATEISPEASKAIGDYVEAQWGKKLVGNPDWNQFRKEAQKRQKDEGWL